MIRELLRSVAVAIVIVLPAWIVCRLLIRLRGRKGDRIPWSAELLHLMMVAYLTALVTLTVIPLDVTGLDPVAPNLVPFRSILTCIGQTLNAPYDLLTHCTADFASNLALMVPFGLLAPLLSKRAKSASYCLAIAAVISLSIEVIQYVQTLTGGVRSPDVDDVILNVVGAGVGYLAITWFRHARAGGNASQRGHP